MVNGLYKMLKNNLRILVEQLLKTDSLIFSIINFNKYFFACSARGDILLLIFRW